jgi:hypothetical protein
MKICSRLGKRNGSSDSHTASGLATTISTIATSSASNAVGNNPEGVTSRPSIRNS